MADYILAMHREYELNKNNRHMDIRSLSYIVVMLLRGPFGFGGGINVGTTSSVQPQQGTT